LERRIDGSQCVDRGSRVGVAKDDAVSRRQPGKFLGARNEFVRPLANRRTVLSNVLVKRHQGRTAAATVKEDLRQLQSFPQIFNARGNVDRQVVPKIQSLVVFTTALHAENIKPSFT